MRIDEKRVVAIIQKLVPQRTGRHDKVIEPAAGKGDIAALLEHAEMGGKQRMQIRMLGIHGDSLGQVPIVPRRAGRRDCHKPVTALLVALWLIGNDG